MDYLYQFTFFLFFSSKGLKSTIKRLIKTKLRKNEKQSNLTKTKDLKLESMSTCIALIRGEKRRNRKVFEAKNLLPFSMSCRALQSSNFLIPCMARILFWTSPSKVTLSRSRFFCHFECLDSRFNFGTEHILGAEVVDPKLPSRHRLSSSRSHQRLLDRPCTQRQN